MKGRAEGGARISAMKGRHSPWVGVGLVIIGLLGLAVVVPLLLGNGTQYGGSWFGLGQRTFSSPGERLFLRDGIDPEGQRLRPPMPRWQVTDQEVQDLVAYLKTL
jgi:hypothetical protein